MRKYCKAVLIEPVYFNGEWINKGTDIQVDTIPEGSTYITDARKYGVVTKPTYIARVPNVTCWFDINRNEFNPID